MKTAAIAAALEEKGVACALISEDGLEIVSFAVRDLASMPPEKAARYRVLVEDARPVVTDRQAIEAGPLAIEKDAVRQTWLVRDLLPAEIERIDLAKEAEMIDARLAEIQTQRAVTREAWDAMNANQLRAEQWRDRQAVLRAVQFLLRHARGR